MRWGGAGRGKETGNDMELEFDVKIDAGILYDYMLHHTFTSFAGVVGAAVGALMVVGFVMTGKVLYLIAGLVILLYQPGSLFLKAKRQAANPAFKASLHYRFTEEGVEVSQGEAKEFQAWDTMYKAVSTGKSIVLYTSRINACLFPRRDLRECQAKAIEMISTHMPPQRVNIRM